MRLVHEGYSAPAIGAITGHKDLREIQFFIEQYNRENMTDFEQRRIEKVQKTNRNLLTGGAS